jgi:sulfatase maturation enzyme AslB (radical SAM superfamily)
MAPEEEGRMKMFRPLNVKCERRLQSSPAEPRVDVVKLPGHTVLYDVNSMAAVEVDDKRIEEPGWVRSLHENGLNCAEKPQFRFFHQTEYLFLVLEATHACNLACAYCFVRNYYEEQGGMMTMDTARRAVDLLTPKQSIAVGFFGGEPSRPTSRRSRRNAVWTGRCTLRRTRPCSTTSEFDFWMRTASP